MSLEEMDDLLAETVFEERVIDEGLEQALREIAQDEEESYGND